jgi:hypothetical protein
MTAEQVVSYLLEEEGLDFLRESLTRVVQQLMESEVSELVGAARGERAPEERLTHRNRYRPRVWATRAGEIELAIPKIRRGSYSRAQVEVADLCYAEPRLETIATQPTHQGAMQPSFGPRRPAYTKRPSCDSGNVRPRPQST